MGIYGWLFEEFMCKQGLPYVDNGNGREAAATKVAFDENGDGKGEIYYWGSIVNEFYIREAYGNDRNNKENNKSMGTQGCQRIQTGEHSGSI